MYDCKIVRDHRVKVVPCMTARLSVTIVFSAWSCIMYRTHCIGHTGSGLREAVTFLQHSLTTENEMQTAAVGVPLSSSG